MTVSMLQFILELPDIFSIKDKRRIVKSLKDRIKKKFSVSVAEVDLQDSLRFTQIGVAMVSNSKKFGEEVMNKIVDFVEDESAGRIQNVEIYTEKF